MNVLELHFIRPAWLLAVPLAILLAGVVWRRGVRHSNWHGIVDPHLLPHLLHVHSGRAGEWAAVVLGLAGVIAATALAGPAWERLPQPMMQTLYGRVMVLDLSRSMDATDVASTRLAHARRKVTGLLELSGDLQTGLVVFAGDAFAVTPLTDDHRTLVSILPVLDTRVMPRQGSRVDLGLVHAQRLLAAGGVSDGEVILVSDGVKGERAIDAAAALLEAGYRVSVLAIGTVAGGVIPLEDGGYLRGLNGQLVKPPVTLAALHRLVRAGGGRLVRAADDDSDIAELTESTEHWRQFADLRETERSSARWRDQGPWLVLALLPLAALAFRRGWLLMLPLVLALHPESPAHAAGNEPPEVPARHCRGDAATRAIILFRNGSYVEAANLFACDDDAEAHYNRGTALARAWQFEQALAAFDQALAREPAHTDALHNQTVVQQLLLQRGSMPPPSTTIGGPDARAVDGASADLPHTASSDATGHAGDKTGAGSLGDGHDPTRPPLNPAVAADRAREAARLTEQSQTADDGVSIDALSRDEHLALEAALARIPDDPAGLWRQKLALKFWRRERTAPRHSDAW